MTMYFVSGHLDLTEEEFEEHYVPKLVGAIQKGGSFVVGDAPGCDTMAQQYLRGAAVTVYHMLEMPRNLRCDTFDTVGGFRTDEERDAAMTEASDEDIAWVRPGFENSWTAKNIGRRQLKDLANKREELRNKRDFRSAREEVWTSVVEACLQGCVAGLPKGAGQRARIAVQEADAVLEAWEERFGIKENDG